MPVGRHASFREGDIAEAIAGTLLRRIAFIAPVPREEDVGIDFMATLHRLEGRMLVPEESFFVQVKSGRDSVRHEMDSDRYRWIRELELPIFYGRADGRALHLYTLRSITNRHESTLPGVVAHTEPTNRARPWDEKGIGHFYVGDPIVSLTDDADPQAIHDALRAWTAIERVDRVATRLGLGYDVTWKTNEVPIRNGNGFAVTSPSRLPKDFAEGDMWLRKLMVIGRHTKDVRLLKTITTLVEYMKTHGVEGELPGILQSHLRGLEDDLEDGV